MTKLVQIHFEGTNIKKEYPVGTTLSDIIKDLDYDSKKPILGALVNNELRELSYSIYKPKTIKFINYIHPDGRRMYVRSLSMVLYKACHDLFPNLQFKIYHAISKGLYCELQGSKMSVESHFQVVVDILDRMKEIIDNDLPFEREEIETQEATKIFEEFGLIDKIKLMQTRQQMYTSVYKLDNVVDYYYGHLVPSTGYLKDFDLVKYYDGMLLMYPQKENPDKLEDLIDQDKLFDIFREYKNWVDIINVPNVGSLNGITLSGKIGEVIKINEALQEKKLASIADQIYKVKNDVRVVLISGPSSSGKTTFSKRLAIQLKVLGMKPIMISLDNYFVNREKTPRDENGEYDFEHPRALDIKLFNDNMLALFAGEEVQLPKFSFTNGSRYYADKKLKIDDKNIIIVEGIHALNPELSAFIPRKRKFKVYVSAITQLGIDSHNRIPTTDNRLLRRIVRDFQYRNYSALDTLRRWQSVRKGEEKYIFPYQEEADVMFNTALLFELGVLKKWVEPMLQEVPPVVPEYSEAKRLLKFLSYFVPIPDFEIPPTSILREFLEGSSFDY
ncbi:MAG: nucleoside kinase [Bacteroidota bacterium]|nr:nucleoside kinase [Bacteroidota bacterium]